MSASKPCDGTLISFARFSFAAYSGNSSDAPPIESPNDEIQSAVELDDNDLSIEKFNGLSVWATSYKIEHKKNSQIVALRILNPSQPVEEKEREFFLIGKMSEVGIAPRVILMDKAKGIVSVEYIKPSEPKPWHPVHMNAKKIVQWANSVKIMHALPIKVQNKRFEEIDNKVAELASAHEQFQLFNVGIEKMREIDAVQSQHISLKFCHNDLGHGGNTLWDGEKAWFIDWELAGDFNPYFDITSPMVLLFFSETNKELFFNTYLGRDSTQREKDLLFINLQYAYLRYGVTSLGICHSPVESFNLSASEIDQIGVWTDILKGKVQLKHEELQTDFGRCKVGILLIKQALENMESDEFKSALNRLKTNE